MYPHDACVDSRESKASRLQFVPSLACVCRFALRARVKVPVLRQSPEHLFGFVPGGLPYGCINTPARARDNAPDAAKLGLTNDFEVC